MALQTHPHNVFKIVLPHHTNQTVQFTVQPTLPGPVTIEVSFGPPTYNRMSHPPNQIEICETAEQESDDEVEIISFRLAPASGPSDSKPTISCDNDDIVVIETKSESGEEFESEPESDEDVIMRKEPGAGETAGVKNTKLEL